MISFNSLPLSIFSLIKWKAGHLLLGVSKGHILKRLIKIVLIKGCGKNYCLISIYLLKVVTLLKITTSDEKFLGLKVLLLEDTSSLFINMYDRFKHFERFELFV